MVMYARKLPRIDDGNTDKREAHSFQSSQYPSKTSYSNHTDRYERQRSPGRDSPTSRDSPRYIHKSSYIERNKEKYDRGISSSPGKRANHNYLGGGSHSNAGNHSNNGNQDRTARVNPKDSEVQKLAIRTCGEWSEHISSSGKKYYYNLKAELSQWEKPREWNEALACRPDRHSTEARTSNDKHGAKGNNHVFNAPAKDNRTRHPSGTLEKREKHLRDVRHMVVDSNPKPDKMFLFEKLQQSQTKLQAEMRANSSNKPLYSSDPHRRTDGHEHSPNDYPNSSSRRCRRDSTGRQTSKFDQDEVESPGSTPTSHRSGGTPHTGPGSTPVSNVPQSNINIASIPSLITQLSAGQNSQELTNKALQTLHKLQHVLSRQIAAHQSSVSNQPTSTPSSTVQATSDHLHLHHHHHHPAHHEELMHPHQLPQQPAPIPVHPPNLVPTMTPAIAHLPVPPQRAYENSHSPGVALSHPPTIPQSSPQAVVSMTMASSRVSMVTGSTTTSIPITHTGHMFPQGNTVYGKLGQARSSTPNIAHLIEDRGGGMSGAEVTNHDGERRLGESDRSSCCSPTPSDTSSQGAPVDPDLFTKSQNGHKENNLMSSLQQYYNQRLVGHVTGWQTELVEKQVQAYRDESLKLSSLITSQISVELKRSRSLVRVEEIQSTLHEQRNLFLAKQIAELESMKPVSSISSFLSSTPAAATTPPATSL